MRNRLVAIFACLLIANVLNYALGEWLEGRVSEWSVGPAVVDGSSLNLSRFTGERPDTALALGADREALLDFYVWLDQGGAENYRNWRTAYDDGITTTDAFIQRALNVANGTNTSRFLALLLLIITVLLLWGKAFKESSWLAPFLYLGVFSGTVALYGSLDAPLYTGVSVGFYVLYFISLRLFLPVFNTEWCRMMRPFLTMQLFLLGVMAFRGPELVDYWFWTSPLFRLAFTFVSLLSFFFHFAIVMKVLEKGKMGTAARYFAIGMPLGFTFGVLGLVLGFYGTEAGESLRELNFELVTLPPVTIAAINPESPFLLTGAGIILGVIGSIGYFIQRIAR